jgi:hypothetical protein
MVPRRLQIVDSLLDLDADSHEADALRLRRAHLARYAKMAMAGALAICFAAGIRIVASSVVGDPEIDGATASLTAQPPTPSGADTSAKPAPTPADEVLPNATERVSRLLVHAKKRRY